MIAKMPVDWQKDLALISLVVRVPEAVVVNQTIAANEQDGFLRLLFPALVEDHEVGIGFLHDSNSSKDFDRDITPHAQPGQQ